MPAVPMLMTPGLALAASTSVAGLRLDHSAFFSGQSQCRFGCLSGGTSALLRECGPNSATGIDLLKGTREDKFMRKISLGLLIAAILVSPAAAAKHKAKRVVKHEPTVAELNDNGYRFVRDSMPLYWPTVIKMMVYGPTTPSRK
jgi:hypothetical protein